MVWTNGDMDLTHLGLEGGLRLDLQFVIQGKNGKSVWGEGGLR